eukprot:1141116-Pelagomonas_calceolata.AAC.3
MDSDEDELREMREARAARGAGPSLHFFQLSCVIVPYCACIACMRACICVRACVCACVRACACVFTRRNGNCPESCRKIVCQHVLLMCLTIHMRAVHAQREGAESSGGCPTECSPLFRRTL